MKKEDLKKMNTEQLRKLITEFTDLINIHCNDIKNYTLMINIVTDELWNRTPDD